MAHLQLEWSNAEVKNGTLRVPLTDKPAKEWRASFTGVAALLNHGTWQIVELKHGGVRVGPVAPGEEERVKHFLESAVLDANTTLASEEELFDTSVSDSDERGENNADEPASPDVQLTGRFRAFAEEGDESQ
jgi:hypothetical protein